MDFDASQRLVRVVCPQCRVSYEPTDEELSEVGLTVAKMHEQGVARIYRAAEKGCEHCEHTGYKGRTAIYELMMTTDDEIRALILKNVDSGTIKRKATEKGMRSLIEDGARKVLEGVTTTSEVLWVAQQDVG